MKEVTVVVIRSLSYTGTTWINALLGCHEKAFALGPPDRVVNLHPEGWQEACRVHGTECSFWPAFHKEYDPKGNFYLQLAKYSGRSIIVVNNPVHSGKASRDLEHPNVQTRYIHVVRDGRAACNSFCSKYPDKDYLDAVLEFFEPHASGFRFDPQDEDVLCVRYEDTARDPVAALDRFGAFLGLQYPANAYRFWEFEHHMAAGNAALIGTIRRFQQNKEFAPKAREFYEKEFQKLQGDSAKAILDERWKEELGDRERFIFDFFCGEINERWGYERDRFTAGQFRQFSDEIRKAVKPALLPSNSISEPVALGSWGHFRPSVLRRRGLHLSPGMLVRLTLLVAGGWLLSLAMAAVAAWVLARLIG